MAWVDSLKNASKTSLVQNERRKVHYVFENGSEMIEEYHLKTNELLVRKMKSKTMTGKETKWEFEIGEDLQNKGIESEGLLENIQNPIFTRKDTKDCFQWRIRNLPYPIETYNVDVDDDVIIIRTTNRKYYKRINIPDMNRLTLKLEQSKISFTHASNTLLVKYLKPKEILDLENEILKELKKLKKNGEGDVEMCSTS